VEDRALNLVLLYQWGGRDMQGADTNLLEKEGKVWEAQEEKYRHMSHSISREKKAQATRN